MRGNFHKPSYFFAFITIYLMAACTGIGTGPGPSVDGTTPPMQNTQAPPPNSNAAAGQDGTISSMPAAGEIFPDLTRTHTLLFLPEKIASDAVFYYSPENLRQSSFPCPAAMRKLPPIEKRGVAYEDFECGAECVNRLVRILYLGAFTFDELLGDNFPNSTIEELSYDFFLGIKMGDTFPGVEYRDYPVGSDQRIQCSSMPLHGYGMYYLLLLPSDPNQLAKFGPVATEEIKKIETEQVLENMVKNTPFLRGLRVTTPP